MSLSTVCIVQSFLKVLLDLHHWRCLYVAAFLLGGVWMVSNLKLCFPATGRRDKCMGAELRYRLVHDAPELHLFLFFFFFSFTSFIACFPFFTLLIFCFYGSCKCKESHTQYKQNKYCRYCSRIWVVHPGSTLWASSWCELACSTFGRLPTLLIPARTGWVSRASSSLLWSYDA